MKSAHVLATLGLPPLAAVALLGLAVAQEAAVAPAQAAPLAQAAPAPEEPVPGMGQLVIPSEQLRRAASVLGGSVAPSDIVVTEDELRRALVYQHGSAALESRKLDLYIAEEMQRQIDAGADPAKFAVAAEDIQAAMKDTLDQVTAQYPTLDPASVLRHNSIDPNDLERVTLQGKLFDIVFLPDDPREWPPTTTEALKSKMGEEFISKMIQGAAEREAAGTEASPDQGQGLFKMLMRQQLRGTLDEVADIEFGSDGLPADVAMRVNGVDVMVSEVYPLVRRTVSEADVQATIDWVQRTKMIESALSQAGNLLDPETAASAYAEHTAPPAEATLFPFEAIVRQFKGFPSMEIYREYWTLLESYRRMIADEVTDEALNGYMAERGNGMLNLARVDSEVILLSAFDFENNRWIENGWEDASERAGEVVAALRESEGEAWGELIEQYSDFWDPPAPTNQQSLQQAPAKKNKGRFGMKYRNELLRDLGESDFDLFLTGSSVADEIFYNIEPGELGGPFVGPYGYYIARVVSKLPPQRTTTIADENVRKMATEDYVATRFNAFARELSDVAAGE